MNRQEAIQIIKNNWPNGRHMLSEALEFLIPELKESEDERVKNEIIAFVEQSIHRGGGTPIPQEQENRWLAWLEKQGEQKLTLEDAAKAFLEALSDTPYNNTPITEAQIVTKQLLIFLSDPKSYNPNAINEQKPADKKYTFNAIPRLLSLLQPTDRAKAYCQKLIDILIQEGYSADANIVGKCLKQMNGEKVAMATMDEQNPVEWSEEDKTNGWTGLDLTRYLSCLQRLGTGNPQQPETINSKWFREHCCPQPKQEWSEEDALNLNQAIYVCHQHGYFGVETWLKSIKRRIKGSEK